MSALSNTCRGAAALFFTPPPVFALSRLPFEPFWQLLPAPLTAAGFWGAPEVALALHEAGGALLGGADGAPLPAQCQLPSYK